LQESVIVSVGLLMSSVYNQIPNIVHQSTKFDIKLVISGFRLTSVWVITQRVVVISYRCFGKIYRSRLQSGLLRSE